MFIGNCFIKMIISLYKFNLYLILMQNVYRKLLYQNDNKFVQFYLIPYTNADCLFSILMQNVYFLLRKLNVDVCGEQNMNLFLHLVSKHCNVKVECISSSLSIEDLYNSDSSTNSKNEMLQCKMNIIVYIMCSI